MSKFEINSKCEGCGLCTAISNKAIQLVYKDGFLCAEYFDSSQDIPCIKCALDVKPHLNPVKNRYVAYHKQIERRMDGSSGGIYTALLETVIKEGYYFTGTVSDETHKVHHIITKDPEQIKCFSGYRPVQSDCSYVLQEVRKLLDKGEKVLFCGTSMQCHALNIYIGHNPNLLIVESINTGAVSQKLLDAYVKEKEEEYGKSIMDIRFCNKEFACLNSKRFILSSGRVYYTKDDDNFDVLVKRGSFTKKLQSRDTFKSLEERIGDISIAQYFPEKEWTDRLGYTYISINTDKGEALFQKAKKRMVIVLENDEIRPEQIHKSYHSYSDNDYSLLNNTSLMTIVNKNGKNGLAKKIINELKFWKRLLVHIKNVSQLRPCALYKFVKFNFFTKGITTNYRSHGLIFIAPYSELSLDDGAQIELNGPLEIGIKRVRNSKLETRLWMKPNSKILVQEKCMFGYGSNVEVYNGGLLEVGNLFSNAELTIICGKHIKLGNTVNIAKGCTVRDTNGHMVAVQGFKQLRPVEIGNHTWICSNSTIMPGVKLGDGVIVGSNSYVSKSVKSFTLVQGNPAVELGNPKYFRI